MNKFGPWKMAHLGLLALALVFCIVCIALLFGGAWAGADAMDDGKAEGASRAIVFIISLLSLAGGVVYVLKEYHKDASLFFNVFFCLQLVASVFGAVLEMVFFGSGAIPILTIITLFGRAVALALLIFLSDLGAKKAWILFAIVGVMDFVGFVLLLTTNVGVAYRVCGGIARLLIAASLALAIRGKYIDKTNRKLEQN